MNGHVSHMQKERLIIFLHGYTGSPTDFADFVRYYQEKGYKTFVPILKGHVSDVAELYDMTFTELLRDCDKQITDFLKKGNYGIITIVGYSVGALLAYNLCEKHRCKGVLCGLPAKLPWWANLLYLIPSKTVSKRGPPPLKPTKERVFYDRIPKSIVSVTKQGNKTLPKQISDSYLVIDVNDPFLNTHYTRKISHNYVNLQSHKTHNPFWQPLTSQTRGLINNFISRTSSKNVKVDS